MLKYTQLIGVILAIIFEKQHAMVKANLFNEGRFYV
jgi:hypothetical protein